jgi:radical SAM superfamily enzyme YgiQ (UPF0313 family)
MYANLASIMPQIVATWCEQAGHKVRLHCYTGSEDLEEDLSGRVDLAFIGAFTESAQLAYAVSNLLRSRGAITAIGGPHARCYPEDARKYFDYVLGFTDRSVIQDVLQDCSPHRPAGQLLSAERHPAHLPGLAERWKFTRQVLRKSPLMKWVSLIGSLGCPYSCSFCVDSEVPYQHLGLERTREDLRFLLGKFKRPHVSWHDPNFGFRFDRTMDAIEEVVHRRRIDFVAESSLSLLTEPRLKRLRRNGFMALLPGIESWFDMGAKSSTRRARGMDKVRKVADQVNLILKYIPYVQTNFVFGLDIDKGREPFELTKRFLDLAPGAFPAYSILTSFGRTPSNNVEYQRANRILPFPFHFLTNCHAMNVRPKNYAWTDFYDNMLDVTRYSFSLRGIFRRHRAVRHAIPRWMNVLRAVSTEGLGRIRYNTEIRRRLDEDPQFRPFFEQEKAALPQFYLDRMRRELGPFWKWLPAGAVHHDPNAYLKSVEGVPSPLRPLPCENSLKACR